MLALQRVAGNRTAARLIAARARLARLAAETPTVAPGPDILAPGASSPTLVAAQLGQDFDAGRLDVAYGRLEFQWILDMFTALQILRVNGSAGGHDRRAFRWLVDNRAKAAPRSRTVLTAISTPSAVSETELAALPPDQAREVRAFVGLSTWDDPASGLPRKGSPRAGSLTAAQQDMIEYIRRRRAVATVAAGTLAGPNHGWQYGGTPTADPNPTGAAPGSLEAEIWQELDLEGSASAVNTYDGEIFTWGKGWSARSTLPPIAQAFFAADPAARQELLEAGFTYSGGKWLWVDTDHGWVVEGDKDNGWEALRAFRSDKKFVGLLAHLVEDPAHQQFMVDAQWGVLRTGGHAGDVPATIRAAWPATWSTTAIRFGAHCVHWGQSWGQVEHVGPNLANLIAWISRIKGTRDPATGAVVVRGWASRTIRHFAHAAAQGLMAAPAPLPDPLVAGAFYYQEGSSDRYWRWQAP